MFIYKLMVHTEEHKDTEKTAKNIKSEVSEIQKMKNDKSWFKLNRKQKKEILQKEGKEFI